MTDSAIGRYREFWGRLTRGEMGQFSVVIESRLFGWAAVVVLALATTALSTMSFQHIPANLREGMIAPRDIKADRNYEMVDEEATQKFREDALARVLTVYDFDEMVLDGILRRLHDAFALARGRIGAPNGALDRSGKVTPAVGDEARREIENAFAEKLGVPPTPGMWKALWAERFSDQAEARLANLLHRAMGRPVVAERASLDAERERGILLRRIVVGAEGQPEQPSEERPVVDLGSLASTEEVRGQVARDGVSTAGFRDQGSATEIVALAQLLVEPNCAVNRAETERRREAEAAGVKNIILKANTGEMIVREGERYTPGQLKTLRAIQKEKGRAMSSLEFLGTFLLVMLFLIVPFSLVKRSFRRIRIARSDYILMALTGLAVLGLTRISLMIAPAVQGALLYDAAAGAVRYAVPIAGGAMLLRMFLGGEVTAVFAIVLSALAGFFVETDVGFAAVALLSSFAAIIAVADVDRRSLIIRAGLITGLVSAAAVAGVQLVAMASATESKPALDLVWCAFFAFLGGIGSAIVAMIGAPIVESVSSYTSDIKLLELANLNHPLLRELIVRAPGSYHHSHMAGILGEAAAEAIGAKALLVRVGAYYHDIGKIRKPLYFIENAKAGENKHERLSPHMSALIIAAHVKDGMEMAEKAGVPRAIIDMIPEHHGTRLISFFYDKAKGQERGELQKIDEKDFMYPGPKPQTREAAILMLADATEAAVRSIKEKSTTRIQQTVQRVITDIFTEKQLDECELTLKDLNEIARAFMRTLLGIYHSRIEYPKDAEHEREKPEISIVDESATSVDLSGMPTPSPDDVDPGRR